MTDARNEILRRLQRGRRKTGPEPTLATGQTATDTAVDRFIHGLQKVSASHARVTTVTQITDAVEQYLQQLGDGNELVITPAISRAHLLDSSQLQLLPAPTRGNEKNALTMAYAGIAETGSLVMCSGLDTPMTTNFLPDNFICILKTDDILHDMESLWARMASEQRPMPRSINLITGPSRTADVEQVIQMGAHGPRRVHVILWDEMSTVTA